MIPPKITIAIVNYNAGPLLAECLTALLLQDMPSFRVVIVDNASQDASLDGLPQDPRITIIRNAQNVGFAAANNQALLDAATPLLTTLNPDTRPEASWLSSLLDAADTQPDVVMFGSSQLSAANPAMADGFGDEYFCSGIGWRRGNGAPTPQTLPGGEVFAPCAAAAMYRRDAYQAQGGFSEPFFCYLEDMDLAFRLRLAGGRCMQVPAAIVHHHGYAITGNRSDFTMQHCTRNMVATYLRCMPTALLLLTLPLHIGMLCFIYAWSWRRGYQRPVGLGLRQAVASLPRLLKERRSIQAQRVASHRDIARAMLWSPMQIIRWRRRVAKRNAGHND